MTAILDLEFINERRAFRTKPARVTDIPCCRCPSRLIKIEFVLGFRLQCDNPECPLFGESQGVELKQIKHKPLPRTLWPSYPASLKRKRELRQARYDLAKSLGIGSYRASLLRDRTKTNIEEYAKHDN